MDMWLVPKKTQQTLAKTRETSYAWTYMYIYSTASTVNDYAIVTEFLLTLKSNSDSVWSTLTAIASSPKENYYTSPITVVNMTKDLLLVKVNPILDCCCTVSV